MPGQGPPPPVKSGKGVLVGLIIGFTVVLLGGGAVLAVIYANSKPARRDVAVQVPTFDPPTDRVAPSADPSAEESPASEPGEPTAAPSQTATSRRTEPGTRLTSAEFDDWNFKLGSVKYSARKVGGWDYDSCASVDGKGVLARYGCDRAVQVAYSAYGGNLKAVQILLAFSAETDAKTVAARLQKLSSDAVRWRRDQTHASYAYGKIRWGQTGNYVVVTVVTATRAAAAKAPKFHGYLQSDTQSYFVFRH
ncbi:hypothetical protein ABZT47_32650 [Sphaerisporangium sp. NPDC005289]|uniref:hypothetical protein n=1 Tax=Sphaerisporangium sp. NPDC005289 TaxID=3155247 RepID=UPI0033B88283